jgi:hypothetical protein
VTLSDVVPTEAEKLLAVAPGEFVAMRQQLARELKDAGRADDAASVARLRKPPPVVLAVNRAARGRPKAARAAADAALRVKQAQVGGDPEAFKSALAELEDSLGLLAEVAVAHVAPTGKRPSESMRRRVRDLLRNAVAEDETREALTRGVLTTEMETPGFAPLAGVAPAPVRRTRGASSESPTDRRDEKRRERERALRGELARAEQQLSDAERSLAVAESNRAKAERAVSSIRARLERL